MIDELIRLSVPFEGFASSRPSGPYHEANGCLRYLTDEGGDRLLCNFIAHIVCDVVRDDGVTTTRAFEIMATHRGRRYLFTVPAERFASLTWVFEQLGASAIIQAGQSVKEHVRIGIQTISGDIPVRREYTHTGWATINGTRRFLTSSGALGADGLDASVVVSLSERLALYSLPEPPGAERLRTAIQASLRMLEVAPIEVTAPIYTGTWRAVLGKVDFTLHLVAQTGAGKTALCALSTQHYGPELDARNTPASWINTANANEALGFTTKDVVLLIDDYAPSGTVIDAAKQQREAERLIRGTGNNQGRTRMRADATIRESKPIRGLLLISGEDTPKGESIRARLLIVEMDQQAMRWPKLTLSQRDAEDGLYASAMAGYVQWLAANESQFERFKQLRTDYRELATSAGDHPRTPGIVADLGAGFRIFCDFATEAGAMTPVEADALWLRVWDALALNATRQSSHQQQSEPTKQFREYLISAVVAGRAHLATPDGTPPLGAIQYGWRTAGTGEQERLEPRGDCIGWILPDGIFLEQKSAYAVAQNVAQRSGETLGVGLHRIRKSMNEKGMLLSIDQKRETLTVRKRIGGQSRDLLHVALPFLSSDPLTSPEPDKPDNTPENPSNDAGNPLAGTEPVPDNQASEPDKPDTQPVQESGISRFPDSEQPNSWKCTCGGRNPNSQRYCDRCGKETRAA